MINGISKWAGSIVIAVMIVTILEMLLPNNKSKKYIKTIMGVYILFTIISPIVKAVSGKNIDVSNLIETQSTSITSNTISLQTNNSIENVYISNIKRDISAKLKQKGYEVNDITLKTEKNEGKDYGRIYEINISIKGKSEKNQSSIPKIEISIGNTGLTKELSNENSITESEKKSIREYLSITYDVNVENITIKEVK